MALKVGMPLYEGFDSLSVTSPGRAIPPGRCR
jgi:hypothetical protein